LLDLEIPLAVISMLPADKLKHLLVVPIELRQSGHEKTLRIAMTDPTNQKLISDLQFATGCRVLSVLASEEEIRQALKNNLPPEPPKAPELQLSQPVNNPGLVDFDDLPVEDPRLDILLEVLQVRGLLSAIDVQRVKYD
jgi:type IV pilus assembly protein PilB